MSNAPRKNEYRGPDGRYEYFGDFDRLCKCGHSLGVHVAGGYECGTDPTGNGEPESAGCKCQRFRPTGKRRVAPQQSAARSAPFEPVDHSDAILAADLKLNGPSKR